MSCLPVCGPCLDCASRVRYVRPIPVIRIAKATKARTIKATLALGLMILFSSASAADVERGGNLYETRCQACHATSVHNRSARKAKSFDRIRAQVERWIGEVGGSWSADEIDDVTVYLNQRYYRFPCPPSMCKASQAALVR